MEQARTPSTDADRRGLSRRRVTVLAAIAAVIVAVVAVVVLRDPSEPQGVVTGTDDSTTTSTTAPTTTRPTTTSIATTTSAGPETSTTTAAPRTEFAYVAPVDTDGTPREGFAVTETLVDGDCSPGSTAVGNAYRCFAQSPTEGSLVLDPCWAETGEDVPPQAVLCMARPWDSTVYEVVTAGLPALEDLVVDPTPWGVQLTSGERCLQAQGARGDFEGRIMEYDCEGGLELLRPADQAAPLWTFDTAYFDGTDFVAGPTVEAALAWFGGP